MPSSYNYKSITVTKTMLEASSGIKSDDLARLKLEPVDGSKEYDVFEILAALMKKWRVSRKAAGGDDDLDAQILDVQLKRERLYKERIHNQARLSVLIPKTEAQNRMIALLHKLRELIQLYIRVTANDLVKDTIKPTIRAYTEYLTLKFNDLFDKMLDDELEIKSWEEDGSTKILRTRLMRADNDKDIDEIIMKQSGFTDESLN